MRLLGRHYEETGTIDQAVEWYQKGLEVDSLAEEFYFRIMRCCSSTGRTAEAVAAYRKCRRMLQAVLGVAPSPDTEALFRAIEAGSSTSPGGK